MKSIIFAAGVATAMTTGVTGASMAFAQSKAEIKQVFLEDAQGQKIAIASLNIAPDGSYRIDMNGAVFSDHFLSMRPFKCLEGPVKNWCHVPYPYEITRNLSRELTDLEYDLLFIWKDKTDYGINMWNGVYYKLDDQGGEWTGVIREMDMDVLSVPPEAGELRPLRAKHLHEADPESHWLPRLVIQ